MKKTVMIEMSYREIEEIVKRVYGATDYSFVATEECGNDSEHKFVVLAKSPLDKFASEDLAEFIEKKGSRAYVNYILFQDLVNKGELEPANYLIGVCW